MNRQSFGAWGFDLDTGDFACALAALGVTHHLTRSWPIHDEDFKGVLQSVAARPGEFLDWALFLRPREIYRFPTVPSAAAAASAWKDFVARQERPVRFRIHDSWHRLIVPPLDESGRLLWRDWSWEYERSAEEFDPHWLAEQLVQSVPIGPSSEDGVGVSFTDDAMPSRTEWSWPLTIGFLDDAESARLRREIERESTDWPARFIELVTFPEASRPCDLLLLPGNARQALAGFVSDPSPKAACTVLLDHAGGTPEAAAELGLIRSRTGCSALVVYRGLRTRRWSWLKELIRELSHNHPLDVALFRCSRSEYVRHGLALIIASDKFLAGSNLSRIAEIAHRRLLALSEEERTLFLPNELRERLGRVEEIINPADLAMNIAHLRVGRGEFFEREMQGASTLNLVNRLPEVTREEPARSVRLIQASVSQIDRTGKELDRSARGFAGGALHSVRVRIGGFDRDWINADVRFPDEELPQEGGGHVLTVVFSEPRLSPEPQVAEVYLPAVGASSECRFLLNVPESPAASGGGVDARIIVLFRNRVLQTAVLRGPVSGWPQTLTGETEERQLEPERGIRLVIEALPRAALEDLDRRVPFDAAFVVNKNADHKSRAFAVRDTEAKVLDLEGQAGIISKIRERLSSIDATKMPLGSAELNELLRFLSGQGAALYRGLIKNNGLDDELAFARRIQVVSARAEAFLPLEFIYDKEFPNDRARLCKNADRALQAGECQETCPRGDGVICPLGFWCLSRTIERHSHSPSFARRAESGAFTLRQADPTAGREEVPVLDGALFGASIRVDKAPRKPRRRVMTALEKVSRKGAWEASSWADWKELVRQHKPSFLVLLPHTDEDPERGLPFMEIREEELKALAVKQGHVTTARSRIKPVVLLLGCETGIAAAPCEHFVAAFRENGASIVLSTTAVVLGRHAAGVATDIATLIERSVKKGPVPFGDLLLSVRRKLLRSGHPIGLCLAAYGDADWILT